MDWRGNAVLDHFFARRDLTTERGDFDDLLAEPDVCQSETAADDPAVAEELFDLIGMRRRADVEIVRSAAQQRRAAAAADQIRGVVELAKPIQAFGRIRIDVAT